MTARLRNALAAEFSSNGRLAGILGGRAGRLVRRVFSRAFGWAENPCDGLSPGSMFVRFTNKCPNRCRFCIERDCVRSWKDAPGRELARITNESGVSSVSIGGGEPCINLDRLLEYLDALDERIRVLYIATSLPKICAFRKQDLVRAARRADLLDVSSHGVTDEEDEAAYGAPLGYGKQALVAELAEEIPDRLCVSCVLRRSAGWKFDDLVRRAEHYYKTGVRRLYLNEMCLDSPFRRDPDFVPLREVVAGSPAEELVPESPFTGGCRTDLSPAFSGRFPGLSVEARLRCFRCGGQAEASWGDVLKAAAGCLTGRRQAALVLNNNGIITDWYPAQS